MKISDLPQPYRALAELRKSQDASTYAKEAPGKRALLNHAFQWSETKECNFWYDVYKGKLPPIPKSSLDELAKLGLWPERLPYDEKPLPEGLEAPPDGYCYVGDELKKGKMDKAPLSWCAIIPGDKNDRWSRRLGQSWTNPNLHYAAPAHLCNRLKRPESNHGVYVTPTAILEKLRPEPFTSIRLPDITPVFTRSEPHTVASYRAALIDALKSAGCQHGAAIVEFYPITKNT